MKHSALIALAIFLVGLGLCWAQVSGNIGYSGAGGKAKAEQTERANRVLTAQELPPTSTATFVEANVLMNVKADEYVAVFGIGHEGETLAECGRKMDATLKTFADELKLLELAGNDQYVDFITQNRIYGFQVQGAIAKEKLVGFELKKNISIHYKDKTLLDKITLAAARAQIFDLIKVDYIVTDIGRVQDKLMEEAARITKNKRARHEKLLGIKLQAPAQVYAEKFAIHYPTQMYDSYTAYEAEELGGGFDRQKYAVHNARKSRTFYFNGLDGNGFDAVINPVVTEPVVQFTLHLKLKYEVEQPRAK